MAAFCETLAETAVVAEACDQAGMGISGAYATRRRNPVFADRLADTGLSTSSRGVRAPTAPAPARQSQPIDWSFAIDALRIGDHDGVARALALLKSNEVEEVEGPPVSLIQPQESETLDLSDRCWWEEDDQCWLTNFPPPAGFTDYESRPYDDPEDDEPYARACTPEETAVLEADAAAERDAERAEDEQLRDAWFEYLEQQASGAALPSDPATASTRR